MKIEQFAGHHEARDALVLSIAGVTAIMLIESLILLILYAPLLKQQSRRRYAANIMTGSNVLGLTVRQQLCS
jgi:hypothetical protein